MWIFAQNAYGYVAADALLKSAIVSIFVAFPTGLLLESQKKELCETSDKLRQSQRELSVMLEQMKRASTIDSLTSVMNGTTCLNKVDELLSQDVTGSLLVIDADDFKFVNDTFGYEAGDRALKGLADTISCQIRGIDLIGRLGGEEFVVFLHRTDRAMAEQVAEKIRESVAAYDFWPTDYQRHPLRVSIGGVHLSTFNTLQSALAEADCRMYRAKKFGKNCCIVTDFEPPAPFATNKIPDQSGLRTAPARSAAGVMPLCGYAA